MLSPCVGVCVLDRDSRLCTGCWRSVQEIARWGSCDDAERLRIMAELPNRRPREPGGAQAAPVS